MLGENSDGTSIVDSCRSNEKWKRWVPWLLLTQGHSRPIELTGEHIQGAYSAMFECMYEVPSLWQHLLRASHAIPELAQTSEELPTSQLHIDSDAFVDSHL